MNSISKPNLQVGATKGKGTWYGSLCSQQEDQNTGQRQHFNRCTCKWKPKGNPWSPESYTKSIINDTTFEMIIHGSRFLQGQDYHLHIEYYKNNMLAPNIQPWPFIVRFAGTGVCYFIIFAIGSNAVSKMTWYGYIV